ncbi:MAG TPA: hypothetical protein VGM84_08800 [Steroidobacteraceae bacterium]|jgi:type I restriction enzyme S subunit
MTREEQFGLVREFLTGRYAGHHERMVAVREFLIETCRRHIELDLGDADLADKLCSGNETRFWQQLSEILLANELLNAGVRLTPSHEGPDFLVEQDGRKIWIEVICPTPAGIPAEWLAQPRIEGYRVPHEEILLRWTAAIKEKAEKLLGNPALKIEGYLAKGVVGPKDAYVIAVNARLLRGPFFPSIMGISQFPAAAEVAFAIGPYALTLNAKSLEVVHEGYKHRPTIRKPKTNAEVPASTFLDPTFRAVSAIWAADIDETWVIGNAKPLGVIHNPEALNPMPVGLLPSQDEYVARANGPDEYVLERMDGTLRPSRSTAEASNAPGH